MRLINLDLLKHPMNWVTVVLMLILAGIGGHLILSYFGAEVASGDNSATEKK